MSGQMPSRKCQRLAVAAVLAVVAAPVRAEGPRLYLPDICIEVGEISFVVPLHLAGEDGRPASLRTTFLFDPAVLEPLEAGEDPAVTPGLGLLGHDVEFSYETQAESGEISIVLNSAGRRPVLPLPAGILAEIRLRLKPRAAGRDTLRLDLDPGRTRSLDSDGREIFTAADVPAYVWIGQTKLRVTVGLPAEDGSATVEASGMPAERSAWLLRGRSSGLFRSGEYVTFREMEPMGAAVAGRPLLDVEHPAEGESFYYLVALPDGTGRPVLGFGSGCRSRFVHTEVTRKD